MTFKEKVVKSIIEEYDAALIIRNALSECEETEEEHERWHFYVDFMLYFQTGGAGLEEADYEKLYRKEDEILKTLYECFCEAEGTMNTSDDAEVFEFIKNYYLEYFADEQ